MLRRSSATVADCHRRALEAAERAERASSPEDRKFWLAREQRWLELAKHQEACERLNDFVSSRHARFRSARRDMPVPEPDEVVRLLIALNGINNPEQMAEVVELAERLARDAPEFEELMDRRRTRH